MHSSLIRQKFFDFFHNRHHTIVSSSPLIPAQDPTILFTNAGMNQFKDMFLAKEKRSYTRAVSIQKCVRAGGKHNDLDNVGFTKRHLTFFEMMGNFSFGDYFKKEAIEYAWEFLTKDLGISTKNLHATVYETDDESYEFWQHMIGLPTNKIHRLGKKDNFWSMGDVGPCGPCTEIHVDRGTDKGCLQTDCGPACDCDRFLEIWNLVFMQYEQRGDGTLHELTQKGVDTGMGLERLAVIMQNVDSVFHTDLFTPLLQVINALTGKQYDTLNTTEQAAFHVLADHARSSALLIADGCTPSNEGRGYVLRKIIRRAALFSQKISDQSTLFIHVVEAVIETMKSIYPELKTQEMVIIETINAEVKKFIHNLIRGNALVTEYVTKNKQQKIIDGKHAFMLYDTYGFPLELIILAAQEHGYLVDQKGFTDMMQQQQEQSGKKSADLLDRCDLPENLQTTFTGYDELITKSKIIGFVVGNTYTQAIPENTDCYLITEKSPFFIVGGGQVPDHGSIMIDGIMIPVKNARYINGRIAVQIHSPIPMNVGQDALLKVDPTWRSCAMKNHTATHLLQAALMKTLGPTIKQAGSLVHPDYLRFDFTYHSQLTHEQIDAVEQLVNKVIMENIPVQISYLPMQDAVAQGALAFFGDKYNPEEVRMVKVDDISVELCGGTHVPTTGTIGVFKITEVTSLSAGQRRIVAVTGPRALELFQAIYRDTKQLMTLLTTPRDQIVSQVKKLQDDKHTMTLNIEALKMQQWKWRMTQLLTTSDRNTIMPKKYLIIDDAQADELREIAAIAQNILPGLYCIVGKKIGHIDPFVISINQLYEKQYQLTHLAEKLRTIQGTKCGGNTKIIQGTTGNIDTLKKMYESE